MRNLMIALVATPFAWGCASFPPPTQKMADAESAQRSARELGADTDPVARLDVKLADEEIMRAKALVASGDNMRADFVLRRARADAELAIALAKEQKAAAAVQAATTQSGVTANAINAGARP